MSKIFVLLSTAAAFANSSKIVEGSMLEPAHKCVMNHATLLDKAQRRNIATRDSKTDPWETDDIKLVRSSIVLSGSLSPETWMQNSRACLVSASANMAWVSAMAATTLKMQGLPETKSFTFSAADLALKVRAESMPLHMKPMRCRNCMFARQRRNQQGLVELHDRGDLGPQHLDEVGKGL